MTPLENWRLMNILLNSISPDFPEKSKSRDLINTAPLAGKIGIGRGEDYSRRTKEREKGTLISGSSFFSAACPKKQGRACALPSIDITVIRCVYTAIG